MAAGRGWNNSALAHVPKKRLLDFFNSDMLQIFEIERFLFDQVFPRVGQALLGVTSRAAGRWPGPPNTNKKGAPGRRPGAPRSETFTGRGPASLTQAERGGAPDQLRRSHANNITQRRTLSSGPPAPKDFIRRSDGPSMNIGTLCYLLETTPILENTARQSAAVLGACQLFVFNNFSCVIWNRFGSGFFARSILKSETSVS